MMSWVDIPIYSIVEEFRLIVERDRPIVVISFAGGWRAWEREYHGIILIEGLLFP